MAGDKPDCAEAACGEVETGSPDSACGRDCEDPETPYDGIDQDCDGADLTDVDGDGFDAVEAAGTDCDDTDPDVHPGSTEVEGDGADNDCDGYADEVTACADGSGEAATIQEAIDLAPDGGAVEICPGRWTEHAVVEDRQLTLYGGGDMPEDTVLDASDGGPAITASGEETELLIDWVSVQGDSVDDRLVGFTASPTVVLSRVDLSSGGADTVGMVYAEGACDGGGSLTVAYSRVRGNIFLAGFCVRDVALLGSTFEGDLMVVLAWATGVASFRNNIVSGGSLTLVVDSWDGESYEDRLSTTVEHNVFANLDEFGVYEHRVHDRGYAGSIPLVVENNIVYQTTLGGTDWTGEPFYYGFVYAAGPSDERCGEMSAAEEAPEVQANFDWDCAVPETVGVLDCSTNYAEEGDLAWTETDGSADLLEVGFVTMDPQFRPNAMEGPYALDDVSPCVDAGVGDADVDGSPADIGAFGGPDGNWFQEYPWPLD